MDASSLYQALMNLIHPGQQSQPMYRALMNGKSDEQRVQDYNQVQQQPSPPQQVSVYGGGNPVK